MVVIWAALFATRVSGQSTQLATLLHGDDVSIFYGSTALKEAVGAAADGDVITLSAGQFDAIDIDKALTIRGAGMGIDNLAGYDIPTIINNHFSTKSPVEFEGISFAGQITYYSDITMHKCTAYILSNAGAEENNVLLTQTLITTSYNHNQGQLTALNCVFNCTPYTTAPGYSNTVRYGNYYNCVFTMGITKDIYYATFTNCILGTRVQSASSQGGCVSLEEGAAVYNSIVVGPNQTTTKFTIDLTTNSTSVHYHDITSVATLFKDGTFYELKDEYKSFITTDGKEIGIYGGNLGFSQVTNTPQITKFNVAPKTSADGKLSVEIEVAGIE